MFTSRFAPKTCAEEAGDNAYVQFCASGIRFCRWFCQVIKVVEVNRVLTWRFYFARILPVGFFMALTLHFGNIVYLYLTVSFIQMLKVGVPYLYHNLYSHCPTGPKETWLLCAAHGLQISVSNQNLYNCEPLYFTGDGNGRCGIAKSGMHLVAHHHYAGMQRLQLPWQGAQVRSP